MKLEFNKTYNNIKFQKWAKFFSCDFCIDEFIADIKNENPEIIIVSDKRERCGDGYYATIIGMFASNDSNDENKEVQAEMNVSMDDNKVAFNLLDIYKHLELWRKEKQIVLEDEKAEYLVNVMGELGKLSDGIRDRNKALIRQKLLLKDYCNISQKEEVNVKIQQAEHKIIDALCNISVLTINAGADVDYEKRITKIEDYVLLSNKTYETLLNVCGNFAMSFRADALNGVLRTCAVLCHKLGFNYELAMLEKIGSLGNNLTRYELARVTD